MPTYDLFFSYRNNQEARVRPIIAALDKKLRVFLDKRDLDETRPVTDNLIESLHNSRSLLCWINDDPVAENRYFSSQACLSELIIALCGADQNVIGAQIIPTTSDGKPRDTLPQCLKNINIVKQPSDDAADRDRFVNDILEKLNKAPNRLSLGLKSAQSPRINIGGDRYSASRFVGRQSELLQIYDALESPASVGSFTTAMILGQVSGMGGVGKSALAFEYARRFGSRYPGGVIRLWAGGDMEHSNRDAVAVRALQQVALGLSLPYEVGETIPELRARIAQKLDGDAPYLWLIDDLPSRDAGELLSLMQAPTAAGRTLITSRGEPAGQRGAVIRVDLLPIEDAVELLKAARPDAPEQDLRQIAEYVGRHCLALTLAAAALQWATPATYLADLQAQGIKALDDYADGLGDALSPQQRHGVAQSFAYSLKRINDEAAWETLRLLSALATAPVPLDFLRAALGRPPGPALTRLKTFGIIQLAVDNSISLHGLLAETIRRDSNATEINRLRTVTWAQISHILEEIQLLPAKIQKLTPLHPHATHLATHFLASGSPDYLWSLGETYYYSGDISLSVPTWTQIRNWMLTHPDFGPEHLTTIDATGWLSASLRSQGDLEQAYALQESNLIQRKKILGPKHPQSITSLNNLASILSKQGKKNQSRLMLEEALILREEVLGKDHPQTIISMNNLSLSINDTGDFESARILLEKTIQISNKNFGKNDIKTVSATLNLGITHKNLGNNIMALELFKECMDIYNETLGPEHHDTINCSTHLSESLIEAGHFDQAQKLIILYLQNSQIKLGEKHSLTDKLKSLKSRLPTPTS